MTDRFQLFTRGWLIAVPAALVIIASGCAPAGPTPGPLAGAMSVPYGVYVASGYSGGFVTYNGAMRMQSDGTYSMKPGGGAGVPDPDTGQSGTYQVIDAANIKFVTGPYGGSPGKLTPNYQGSGRKFIDVTYQGTTTSYGYSHP
jgi:hypothetical protein